MGFSLFGPAFPFSGLFAAQAGRLLSSSRLLENSLADVGSALSIAREITDLAREGSSSSPWS